METQFDETSSTATKQQANRQVMKQAEFLKK